MVASTPFGGTEARPALAWGHLIIHCAGGVSVDVRQYHQRVTHVPAGHGSRCCEASAGVVAGPTKQAPWSRLTTRSRRRQIRTVVRNLPSRTQSGAKPVAGSRPRRPVGPRQPNASVNAVNPPQANRRSVVRSPAWPISGTFGQAFGCGRQHSRSRCRPLESERCTSARVNGWRPR